MPNFFQTLLNKSIKSNKSRSRLQTHPQPIPSNSVSPYTETAVLPPDLDPVTRLPTSTKELEELADLLRDELATRQSSEESGSSRSGDGSRGVLKGFSSAKSRDNLSETGGRNGSARTLNRLLEVLEDIKAGQGEGQINPYVGTKPTARDGDTLVRPRNKGKEKERSSATSGAGISGNWAKALEMCSDAHAYAGDLLNTPVGKGDGHKPLKRVANLLKAQRLELVDLRGYEEGRPPPTLKTLGEIYEKIKSGLKEVYNLSEKKALIKIETLLQVLQEGPDYLIDVIIIEAIVWQAEIIDPNFGGDIRGVMDRAVAEQRNPSAFRRAAEEIVRLVDSLPTSILDDTEGVNAFKAIQALIRQLQIRVSSNRDSLITKSRSTGKLYVQGRGDILPPSGPRQPIPAIPSPPISPTPSTLSSVPDLSPPDRSISPAISSDRQAQKGGMGMYKAYDASDLQAVFDSGSGSVTPPLPPTSIHPTVTPSRQVSSGPASPISDESTEQELWEYRGQLLTRSALSLVLRQEALALADSSGQYAGDVSWDDIRNAWIPKWAEKLKPKDLAEGEIRTTNPNDFKVKRRDAWGNKIGWNNGQMFYHEEPVFELRE